MRAVLSRIDVHTTESSADLLRQSDQAVVLGVGKPFFPAVDRGFRVHLVETRTLASRVVYLRYAR